MNAYSIFPHVADVRLQVRGESYEQLFAVSLEGMNRILNKDYKRYMDGKLIEKEISVASYDRTSLLIDFLSEVLTLSHIHKAIFHTIEFSKISENFIHAHLLGAKIDKFEEDIKAVTYHEAEIKQNNKGQYEAAIVFDV